MYICKIDGSCLTFFTWMPLGLFHMLDAIITSVMEYEDS